MDVTGTKQMHKNVLIFFKVHEEHFEYKVTWKSNMMIGTEK